MLRWPPLPDRYLSGWYNLCVLDRMNRWRDGLARTRQAAFGRIATLLGQSELDELTWDELEAALIQSDLGLAAATEILEELKNTASSRGIIRTTELAGPLRETLLARLDSLRPLDLHLRPTVILIVGVNGSGKTTSIARLARYLRGQGRSVILAAGDTFRAAAVEQLEVWGKRLGIEVVAGQPDGDPGAVAHDAAAAALARKVDILIVDTAGRLHTRFNLMEELKKVRRVLGKVIPGAPHHTLLVLDATTGQNALAQARAFKQAVEVTGVILAKLDSSARGGMIFAVQRELGLPIQFVGLGEKLEDWAEFEPEKFVEGIMQNAE